MFYHPLFMYPSPVGFNPFPPIFSTSSLLSPSLQRQGSMTNTRHTVADILRYPSKRHELPIRPFPIIPQYPPIRAEQNSVETVQLPKYFRCDGKERRPRTVFSHAQIKYLERQFQEEQYISPAKRERIAETLGLTQLQVKTWYQNRRMKWKREVQKKDPYACPTRPKGRPKRSNDQKLC